MKKKLLEFIKLIIIIFPCCLAAEGKSPLIWNVQTELDSILRNAYLDDLHKRINKKTGTVQAVALTGPSGIGKTYVAKMYAEQYKNEYDFVWFFNASKNIELQLIELAKAWNSIQEDDSKKININEKYIDKEFIESLKEKLKYENTNWLIIFDDIANFSDVNRELKENLRKTEANWLLIFDDASSLDEVRKYIPEGHKKGGRSHVIFTSQNINIWPNEMQIGTLSRDESIQVFKFRNPKIDLNFADNLSNSLGDYPITVASASAAIRSTHRYVNNLEENWKSGQGYSSSLGDAIDYVSHTSNKIKEESDGAYKIFMALSLLNKDYISDDLLWEIYRILVDNREDTYLKDIEILKSYLFLREKIANLSGKIYFQTHAVYQYAGLKKISKKELDNLLSKIVTALSKIYGKGGKVSLDASYMHVLDQTEKIVSIVEKNFNYNTPEYISLVVELIEFNSMVKREYLDSLKYGERIKKSVNNLSKTYNGLKHRYYNDMSGVYWWLGRPKEGLDVQSKALLLAVEENYSKDERLRGLLYKAAHLTYLGEIEQAVDIVQLVDKHIESYSFSYSNNKIFSQYNAALTSQIKSTILMNQGRLREALAEQQNALDSISKIAITLNGERKLTSRFNYYTNFYEIKSKYLGLKDDLNELKDLCLAAQSSFNIKEHRLVGLLLTLYAISNIENGNIEQAIGDSKLALSYFNNWFGAEKSHRDQAFAYKVLGDSYAKIENFNEAYLAYSKAKATYNNCYTNLETFDYSDILKKMIHSLIKLEEYSLAKENFKHYVDIFGSANKEVLSLLDFFGHQNI